MEVFAQACARKVALQSNTADCSRLPPSLTQSLGELPESSAPDTADRPVFSPCPPQLPLPLPALLPLPAPSPSSLPSSQLPLHAPPLPLVFPSPPMPPQLTSFLLLAAPVAAAPCDAAAAAAAPVAAAPRDAAASAAAPERAIRIRGLL